MSNPSTATAVGSSTHPSPVRCLTHAWFRGQGLKRRSSERAETDADGKSLWFENKGKRLASTAWNWLKEWRKGKNGKIIFHTLF
jgi:hypothetical protein